MQPLTEVLVSGLALDMKNNSPVVILKEKDGERILPIWIGVFEANAIAMQLAGVSFKRPLTYDLVTNLLLGLEAKIVRVVVSEIRDNTYYAKLFVQRDEAMIEIDARPSDSIALALKTEAPIFVDQDVLESFGGEGGEKPKYSAAELRERLKKINPEDFGDFEL
jgi:bifunctional DNase/RNase